MKNKLKERKGITLIALVITIIVLLILAGVSIAMLTGDNGILTQANNAKKETEVKGLKEEVNLMMQKRKIDESTGQKVALKEDLEKEISGNKGIEEIEGIAEAYYVTKDNQTVTVYEDGTVAEGKAIWDGVSKSKPTVDSEGNWHIKTPEEFKYFADFVNGKLSEEEKAGLSIGETTIVNLENHIDLGARQENGTKTRGTNWDSIGKTKEVMFSGIFEGNNNIIRGIYIDEVENFTGLFGRTNEIKNLVIKDSYIRGGNCIGAFAGIGYKLENCYNENTTVVSKEGNYYAIGGIAGQINEKIENCSNSGTIIANGKQTSTEYNCCGGIIGVIKPNSNAIVKGCKNTGAISGNGNMIGGIIGRTNHIITTIENCYNAGKVKGKGERIGGITGEIGQGVTISYCNNTGEIVGENKLVGGIAGINLEKIEKSENSGKVKGKGERVGGIAGNNSTAESLIKECKNTGEIVGESYQVGGIAGGSFGNISKCYNKGTITTKDKQAGGIAGLIGAEANSVISNCYNEGEVIGNYYVGGILGYIYSGATTAKIENNYNIGKTKGKEAYIGGVIGKTEFVNTVIENNYYLKETAESGNGSIKQDEIGKTERKEEQEMKTEEFGNVLNAGQEPAVWKGIDGAYPELIN